jgi:hypothetical protein
LRLILIGTGNSPRVQGNSHWVGGKLLNFVRTFIQYIDVGKFNQGVRVPLERGKDHGEGQQLSGQRQKEGQGGSEEGRQGNSEACGAEEEMTVVEPIYSHPTVGPLKQDNKVAPPST